MRLEEVAVVIPLYRAELTGDEKISFRHLCQYLGSYRKYLVVPRSLSVNHPGFFIERFDDAFFTDIPSYSRLMLSRQFYERFQSHTYILLYQLDCLVFSSQLYEWCARGYDYIGAPWLRSMAEPEKGFARVGNGGLSLRRVSSFLKVIDSPRYTNEPCPYWRDVFYASLPDLDRDTASIRYRGPGRWLKRLRVLREVRPGAVSYAARYTLNEDHFWSDRARLFYPDFKIAPVEEALQFSFDLGPRYCFESNSCRLPFGCHGWYRHDREFWSPYLIGNQS